MLSLISQYKWREKKKASLVGINKNNYIGNLIRKGKKEICIFLVWTRKILMYLAFMWTTWPVLVRKPQAVSSFSCVMWLETLSRAAFLVSFVGVCPCSKKILVSHENPCFAFLVSFDYFEWLFECVYYRFLNF